MTGRRRVADTATERDTDDDALASVPWWRPWARWLPIVVVVVGFTLIWISYRHEVGQDSNAVDRERSAALSSLESDIHRRFEAHVDELLGLKGFFEASESVSRSEFAQFIASSDILRRNPGYQAIEWAPLVQAENVNEFVESVRLDTSLVSDGYPEFSIRTEGESPWLVIVDYVEPLVGNEAAFGFDLSSNPARLATISETRRTGSPVATAPITLVQETGSQTGMLLIDGVTRADSPEVDGFAGVVLSVFRVGDLLGGIKADTGPDFLVTDVGPTESNEQVESTRIFQSASQSVPSGARETIDISGRQWEISLAEGAIPDSSGLSMFLGTLPSFIAVLAVAFALRAIERSGDHAERRAQLLTSELRDRNAMLKRANDGLESFTRVASHDLRSPLRAIASLVGFIREDADDELEETTTHNLKRIEERVDRMNSLIDDLLTLSQTSDPQNERSQVSYDQLITEVVDTVNVPEGFTITTEFDGPDSGYLARTQLAFCIRNLVDNAFKHHDRETGTLAIRVTSNTDHVEVSVSDDGPGIPQKYLEAIFEPFRRLRPDEVNPGSGIGLTTILRNTELNGGSVTVSSEEGAGSTFLIRWPLDASPSPGSTESNRELASSLS